MFIGKVEGGESVVEGKCTKVVRGDSEEMYEAGTGMKEVDRGDKEKKRTQDVRGRRRYWN